MSKQVVRVEKMKGGSSVAGIQIHCRREKESRSNPNIDPNRKHLNYTLVETDKTYNDRADEIIMREYTGDKAIRKDAVRVLDMIFTSDGAFFEDKTLEQQRAFFEDCMKWARDTFGARNVVAATVHMDEDTPHLHAQFVPLTADGRLSAKEWLGGSKKLQKLQDDFHKTVGKPWGLERGDRADLSDPDAPKPRKHDSVKDFKRKTRAKAEKEAAEIVAEAKLTAADERARLGADRRAVEADRQRNATERSNLALFEAWLKKEKKDLETERSALEGKSEAVITKAEEEAEVIRAGARTEAAEIIATAEKEARKVRERAKALAYDNAYEHYSQEFLEIVTEKDYEAILGEVRCYEESRNEKLTAENAAIKSRNEELRLEHDRRAALEAKNYAIFERNFARYKTADERVRTFAAEVEAETATKIEPLLPKPDTQDESGGRGGR
jgi:hypothetical protein